MDGVRYAHIHPNMVIVQFAQLKPQIDTSVGGVVRKDT